MCRVIKLKILAHFHCSVDRLDNIKIKIAALQHSCSKMKKPNNFTSSHISVHAQVVQSQFGLLGWVGDIPQMYFDSDLRSYDEGFKQVFSYLLHQPFFSHASVAPVLIS